jgi:hypothetical protein
MDLEAPRDQEPLAVFHPVLTFSAVVLSFCLLVIVKSHGDNTAQLTLLVPVQVYMGKNSAWNHTYEMAMCKGPTFPSRRLWPRHTSLTSHYQAV